MIIYNQTVLLVLEEAGLKLITYGNKKYKLIYHTFQQLKLSGNIQHTLLLIYTPVTRLLHIFKPKLFFTMSFFHRTKCVCVIKYTKYTLSQNALTA